MELKHEDCELPETKYEYLDHTADIQLHAWGDTLKEAFEQCAVAMYGYMTELDYVEIKSCHELEASGHDLESLLYGFLDECLFLFSCEPYIICKKVIIDVFDLEEFKVKFRCFGEEFEIGKHPQGTEVKAITYSAMQIINDLTKNRHEVFVILDI